MSALRAGFLCLLFLTAISGFSATNATLRGRVLDDSNVAVPGLPVSLEPIYGAYGGGLIMQPIPPSSAPTPAIPPVPDSDLRPRLYATTGRDGSFNFEGAAGGYVLNTEWENSSRIYPARVGLVLTNGETVTNFVFRVHRANVEIHGKVTGAGGEVFTNTTVNFAPAQVTAGLPTTAITDETGSYRVRVFAGEWVGTLSLYEANQHGYFVNAQTNVVFSAPGTNEVNFVLERPPYTLSGVVMDDRGEPIANIPLTASHLNAWPYNRFEVVSDADGRFSFWVVSGRWAIGYSETYPPRNLPYKTMFVYVDVAGANVVTNLILPKTRSRLNGVVKTPEGEPMASVTGQMTMMFGNDQLYDWFTTDTNGQFSVAVANGQWRVMPHSSEFNRRGYVAPPEIGISLVDSTNLVTFTAIHPPSKLRGTVRDETGAPVTNLPVRVYSWEAKYASFSATTDSEGRYVVGVAPAKWLYEVQGTNQGTFYHVNPIDPVEVGDGEEAVRDITLVRAPHRLRVTLRDENGALVASTNWQMLNVHSVDAVAPRGVDAWFNYGIAEVHVAPGEWRVLAQAPSQMFQPIPGTILLVTNDVSVTFTVRKRVFDSTLSGQAVDEEGAPVTNATASAYSSTPPVLSAVDAEGKFSFAVEAGLVSLAVDARGYVTASRRVEVAPNTNVFRLVRARKASATLVVRITAPPGAPIDVFGINARTRIGNDIFRASAPVEGGVARLKLFPGEWDISAWAANPSGRQMLRRSITVSGGEELTLNTFAAAPTAKIRGRVVDEHGDAISLGGASAESIAGRVHNGLVKPDGSFEISVSPGSWWVSLSAGTVYHGAYFSAGEVVDGQQKDVGAIMIPTRGVVALMRLRTASGEIPEFPYGFNAMAKRTVGGVTFTSSTVRYNGDILLPVAAGDWEFSFWDWQMSEFASIQPRIFNIPPGGATNLIVLQPRPAAVSGARFSIASEPGGRPRLRMQLDRTDTTEIESSSDFKTWRLRSDEDSSMGYVDIPAETATNRVEFFRAVTIE
jgi:hypothetical protein